MNDWSCNQCGWLLGIISRDTSRAPHLNVFCTAREPQDKSEHQFAVVELAHGTIVCSNCNHRQTWYLAERMLLTLLKRRHARSFGVSK
jgi:hypothetical protein